MKRKNNVELNTKELNQRGITLIVLIITVIIMLILIAVVIDVSIDGKLIDSAKEAVEGTNNKVGQVQTRTDELMGILDDVSSCTTENINITLSLIHEDVSVTADGTKVGSVVDGVPIPVGFVASGATGENTKEGGLVIYAGADPVNDSNVATAQTERDQFVWVPVVQNQRIKIEVTSKNNIDGIEIKTPNHFQYITTDKNGNKLNPSGKSYETEIIPTLNGEYSVTVTTGGNSVTKTITTNTVYGADFLYDSDYDEVEEYLNEEYTYIVEYEFTEDYATDGGWYDSLQDMLDDWYWPGISLQEAIELRVDEWFNDYFGDYDVENRLDSVNKYGGFYIARYEAGSNEPDTESLSIPATIYSRKNKYPYNNINIDDAIENCENMFSSSESVTASLVNSAAWARTLHWLIEANEKNSSLGVTYKEVYNNSKTWGNYYDSTFEFNGYYSTYEGSFTNANTTKPENSSWLLGTGVSDYTKRNNIYDLAGNVGERTMGNGFGFSEARGGECRNENCSVLISALHDAKINEYYGFRPTLYINP